MANAGDTCEDIIFRSNRVTNVLYDNNLVLGPRGKYCDTQLLAGYWYCVGTPTITATTTGAPLTVAQTQPTPAAVGAVQKGPASASVTTPTTTNGPKSPVASATAVSSLSLLSSLGTFTAAKPATDVVSPAVTPSASATSVISTTRVATTTSVPPLTLRSSISPTTSTTAKPVTGSSASSADTRASSNVPFVPFNSPAPASTSAPPPPLSSSTAAATSAAGGAGGGGTAVAVPEGATYLGCASEVPGRTLNQHAMAGAGMTIEKCLAFCGEARFPLAGLEYGSECFCGTTLAPPSALGNPEACRMACSGNQNQICGGPSLLSVFKNNSITAAPPPVEAAAPQKVGAAGFAYQGCYDEGKGRVLPDAMMGNDTLTVELCVAFCEGKGYGLAGVEYGRECWCGKSLQSGAVKLDEGRCGMRCKGEESKLCGGSGAIGVYEKKGGGGGGGKAKKRDENQESEDDEELTVLEERDKRDNSDGENETKEYTVEEERPQTAVKTIRLVRRGRWGGRRHA